MLQIATGKLFARPVRLENQLRGVLHTNARLGRDEAVETAAGKLLPASDGFRRPQAVVYEFVERIEAEAVGPAFFISSGVEPYLQDFAVAASFALNCTFSPNLEPPRAAFLRRGGVLPACRTSVPYGLPGAAHWAAALDVPLGDARAANLYLRHAPYGRRRGARLHASGRFSGVPGAGV
jgi:hypothetical protein